VLGDLHAPLQIERQMNDITMAADFAITTLTADDIPENLALARAVKWPDVEADWRVVHAAALVLGARRGTRLIGQGALAVYGDTGTIAKMIVAPEEQGRGVGKQLLDALLAEAERRSLRALGLVATPFGRPLYERREFNCVGDVVILTGVPQLTASDPELPALSTPELAIEVEQRYLNCSRASMLRARFREALAGCVVPAASGASAPSGYAMVTEQAQLALVGPIIAEHEADARRLASASFRASPGAVRIDVPAEQLAFRSWLQGLGLRELGTRVEMARGAARLPWQVPQRFALAAQAWG
jgi:GNAT superfamily N-acetyltransferase